ncbi:MAG: reverse transcriptase-like protein [Desulfamplus sp.]|nr:reverse transcriptase-like protein [Desulfamplus sp.]
MSENIITIYTDGASSGNPGPGGIGIFLKYNEHEKEISESIGHTTNNIAELTAIKRALLELKRYDLPVRLYTDSSYALGILTKRWKATKNQELVAETRELIKKFKDIRFIKTKGHAGVVGNEKADALATQAIKKISLTGK